MTDATVARRYAQALYEEAVEAGTLDRIDEDVALIDETLGGSRELVRFFESPIIGREKKEAVVEQLFGERLTPLSGRLLRLLIEKQRENLFPAVVAAYQQLRDEQRGVVEARARVALPLSEEERATLSAALERMTGTKIRLAVEHDPALLGGLVVRVGDVVYDGSVRHQLATLRERMEQGALAVNGHS